MKKAQNVGQIMMYVLAIVIVGLVLLLGYKAISKFGKSTDKISLLDFQQKITSQIKKVSSQFGREEQFTISVPGDIKYICMANDVDAPTTKLAPSGFKLVDDALINSVNKNVFALNGNKQFAADPLKVSRISVKETITSPVATYWCYEVKAGKLNIHMKGFGDYVEISQT